MSYLNRLNRSLEGNNQQNNFNTRRVAKNLPYIERKLDLINYEESFKLEFKDFSSRSVRFNLQFKSDNCCDCEYGYQVGTRFLYATYLAPPNTFGYNTPVAITYDDVDQTGYYGNPIIHTSAAFTTKTWVDYGTDAPPFVVTGSEIAIPVNGFYNLSFNQLVLGGSLAQDVEISLRKNGEIITKRTYNQENFVTQTTLQLVANCIPLFADDIVEAYIDGDVPRPPDNFTGFTTGSVTVAYVGTGAGGLKGKVYYNDTQLPAVGVTVTANILNGYSEVTDINGDYLFKTLPPGSYTVTVSSDLFDDVVVPVTVLFGELVELNIGIIS